MIDEKLESKFLALSDGSLSKEHTRRLVAQIEADEKTKSAYSEFLKVRELLTRSAEIEISSPNDIPSAVMGRIEGRSRFAFDFIGSSKSVFGITACMTIVSLFALVFAHVVVIAQVSNIEPGNISYNDAEGCRYQFLAYFVSCGGEAPQVKSTALHIKAFSDGIYGELLMQYSALSMVLLLFYLFLVHATARRRSTLLWPMFFILYFTAISLLLLRTY